MAIKLATLETEITVDTRKAKASVHDFAKAAEKLGSGSAAGIQRSFKGAAAEASNFVSILTGNKLTGATSQITSFANAVGAIPGPAGLAIGSLTGLAAVATGAGIGLYKLASTAAEYGSTIHDASIKTGLGAESISALKFAGDQSGVTLEQLTGGLAKFSKNVVAAGKDADKSAAFMKDFGVRPLEAINDLDGSLAKVFKRIGDAKPGVEQITLAQRAFGKSGADLIPLLEQTGYNLDEFRKKAKELGVTISDDAAAKADEFGDLMTQLDAQFAGVARTVGNELIPVFLRLGAATSDFLSKNQDEIRDWGTTVADVMSGVISYWNEATTAVGRFWAESRSGGQSPFTPGSGQGATAGDIFKGALIGAPLLSAAARGADDRANTYGPFSYEMNRSDHAKTAADLPGSGKIHKAPKESDKQFRQFFEDLGFKVNRTHGGAINAGSPHTYGGAADLSVHGKGINDIFSVMMKSLEHGYRVVDESGARPAPGIKRTGPNIHVENAKTTLSKGSIFTNEKFSADQLAYLRKLDAERLGKATGMGGFDSFKKDQSEDAKKKSDEDMKSRELGLKHFFELGQAGYDALIKADERFYDRAMDSGDSQGAIDAAQRIHDKKVEMANDEVAEAKRVADAQVEGSDAAEQANFSYSMAVIKANADIAEAEDDLEQKRKKVHDAEDDRNQKLLKQYQDIVQSLEDMGDAWGDQEKAKRGAARDKAMGESNDTWTSGIGRGTGIDLPSIWDDQTNTIKDDAEILKGVYADVRDFAGGAIGEMASSLADLGVQWLVTGDFSAKAALTMLAASAMHIATEAGFKGIFEIAEASKETALAAASLAVGDATGAALHTKAAAAHGVSAGVYFKVAAIAGAAGVGLGIGARAAGGGSGAGGGATGSGGRGRNNDESQQPYSRMSDDVYISGRRSSNPVAAAVDRLTAKIESMKPGDVLTTGMRQKPGAVLQQATKDARSGRGGRDFAGAIGLK